MARTVADTSQNTPANVDEGHCALLSEELQDQPKDKAIEQVLGTQEAVLDMEVMLPITRRDFEMSHTAPNFDLPDNIYGAAMMSFIRSSQTYHSVVHLVTTCIFAGLVLNLVIQFYVLICTKVYITAPAVLAVRDLYQTFHEQVFEDGIFSQARWDNFKQSDALCQMPLSQPMFFLCILSIWTATCWVDLLDSYKYLSLWMGLPAPQGERKTEVESGEDDAETVVLVGATKLAKAFALGMILIPKIVIACLLWWLGARWLVATTSFQDLLLNAVALAFITELDELIYMSLMPGDIQAMVQTFKIKSLPAKAKPNPRLSRRQAELADFVAYRDKRLALMMGQMAMTALVVVALPLAYMYRLQRVLPGYKFDVHRPCQSNMGSMLSSVLII